MLNRVLSKNLSQFYRCNSTRLVSCLGKRFYTSSTEAPGEFGDKIREHWKKHSYQNEELTKIYFGNKINATFIEHHYVKMAVKAFYNFFEKMLIDDAAIPKEIQSPEAKDCYLKIKDAYRMVHDSDWDNQKLRPEAYDEWENAQDLFKRVEKAVTPAEREILEEELEKLNEVWEYAIPIENMITVMEQFIQKYHNQFLSPVEDLPTLFAIVDKYNEIMEKCKDPEIKRKATHQLLDKVHYLRGKVLIPELSERYPVLFK